MLPHKVAMNIKYVNENKALCPIVPTGILNFWTFIFWVNTDSLPNIDQFTKVLTCFFPHKQ